MICARCNTPIPQGAIACPVCNAPAPPAVKRPYGLYIFAAVVLLGYGEVLLFAYQRTPPAPQTGMALMVWTGILGYYRAKKLGGSRWKSAIVGACLGVLVFVAAAFLAGLRS